VHAKHVKEAYRLLNKSIIRVEQPDIYLDEEEQLADEPMDLDGGNRDVPNAESGAMNGMYISFSIS
jgi:DNA replication licensing factor MCM6